MIPDLLRSMRPAQWAKNVFVLAPLVFARLLTDPAATRDAALAFVAFCFASSAVYLFNDLRDREEDRRHPLKKNRPIAAGRISVWTASAAIAVLVTGAAAIGIELGATFLAILLSYLLLQLFYTLGLKRVVILDVLTISVGFVLRVMAGGAAIEVRISAWLLLCTIFLSLFLAFSKRRHEMVLLGDQSDAQRKVLQAYSPAFLDQMINVVTASSVVSYALYAISEETHDQLGTEHLIYTMPLVLFGVFRYLYLVYQNPDAIGPTEAILRDRPFLLNMLLWSAAVVGLVYGGLPE